MNILKLYSNFKLVISNYKDVNAISKDLYQKLYILTTLSKLHEPF